MCVQYAVRLKQLVKKQNWSALSTGQNWLFSAVVHAVLNKIIANEFDQWLADTVTEPE